ncbi:MAG: hypothetical protein HS126_12960 [Anaerolineales bacterium]|nr:hypothetical protein [Anaerolineales bacterium]
MSIEDALFFIAIGGVLWLWGRLMHNNYSRDQIFVPNWILRFSGSQLKTVSLVGLTFQVFGLLFVLWLFYLFFIVAPGEERKILGQRGCLAVAILSYLFVRFVGRKSYDFKK